MRNLTARQRTVLEALVGGQMTTTQIRSLLQVAAIQTAQEAVKALVARRLVKCLGTETVKTERGYYRRHLYTATDLGQVTAYPKSEHDMASK